MRALKLWDFLCILFLCGGFYDVQAAAGKQSAKLYKLYIPHQPIKHTQTT